LPYHSIVDWRLGLDLARLALDPAAPIDFTVAYWQGVDTAAAGPYFAAMPGWQPVTFAGLQAGRRGNRAEIIAHPLWNSDSNFFGPQQTTQRYIDGDNLIPPNHIGLPDETRPAAIRALILYPLNALVEDQLARPGAYSFSTLRPHSQTK
jgi:hypothetical protein